MLRALLLPLLLITATTSYAARPNIVAIVTDDQGQWACGAYGNEDIVTPHMDSLARDGLLFRKAMTVCPVCSPSRASYFSGRWPTEVAITDWISPQEAQEGLGLKERIWPEVLHAAGYRTGLFGKWHLGELPAFHPKQKGFDEFFGFLAGGNRPMNPTLEVNGETEELTGPLPDLLTSAAIDFIKAGENAKQPFLVCLHFRAPHLPYLPLPDEDLAPFKNLDPKVAKFPGAEIDQLKKMQRDYYASIHSVDRNVGRLLKTLDESNLRENTLVLFTSDHGYNNGLHGVDTKGNGQWMAGGVRGPKRPNMWDTSIKIPLLIRWPGVTPAGRESDFPLTTLDMFRTMLGAADVDMPENVVVHGEDCSAVFKGESGPKRDEVFGMYDLHNGGLAYLRMIRTGRYKYIRHFRAKMMDELYDLEADPEEAQNLARRANPNARKVLTDLETRLTAWQKSIDDPVLRDAY